MGYGDHPISDLVKLLNELCRDIARFDHRELELCQRP